MEFWGVRARTSTGVLVIPPAILRSHVPRRVVPLYKYSIMLLLLLKLSSPGKRRVNMSVAREEWKMPQKVFSTLAGHVRKLSKPKKQLANSLIHVDKFKDMTLNLYIYPNITFVYGSFGLLRMVE